MLLCCVAAAFAFFFLLLLFCANRTPSIHPSIHPYTHTHTHTTKQCCAAAGAVFLCSVRLQRYSHLSLFVVVRVACVRACCVRVVCCLTSKTRMSWTTLRMMVMAITRMSDNSISITQPPTSIPPLFLCLFLFTSKQRCTLLLSPPLSLPPSPSLCLTLEFRFFWLLFFCFVGATCIP